jgi:hypothetical protein
VRAHFVYHADAVLARQEPERGRAAPDGLLDERVSDLDDGSLLGGRLQGIQIVPDLLRRLCPGLKVSEGQGDDAASRRRGFGGRSREQTLHFRDLPALLAALQVRGDGGLQTFI